MNPLTVFSWGYWGWGTATKLLVEAVDAVEASRGFEPPLFVDIRFRRSGRAPGFVGDAFRDTVGTDRYQHIQGLGNEAIGQGGPMRIHAPNESNALLELAIKAAESNRRVIFYCACEFPGTPSDPSCHRTVVAGLLLELAKKKKVPMRVIEWPGGDVTADRIPIDLPQDEFAKLIKGKKSIPLRQPFSLAEMAGVPHFTIVEVWARDHRSDAAWFLTGPARYKEDGWYLPAIQEVEKDDSASIALNCIQRLRDEYGYAPRQV